MQERREKGLCYFCDERYQPGHRCNRLKIYLLEGMGMEEESRMQESAEETLPVEELEEATWKDPHELRKKHPDLVDKVF
jgi:hypothetical protein